MVAGFNPLFDLLHGHGRFCPGHCCFTAFSACNLSHNLFHRPRDPVHSFQAMMLYHALSHEVSGRATTQSNLGHQFFS
jgi:hypothetical protein